jgi:hypothetical protein
MICFNCQKTPERCTAGTTQTNTTLVCEDRAKTLKHTDTA